MKCSTWDLYNLNSRFGHCWSSLTLKRTDNYASVSTTERWTLWHAKRLPSLWLDELLDSLGEVAIFSMLDVNFGYRQIDIDDWDNEETMITLHHELYIFLRVILGLRIALTTFQCPADVILSKHKLKFRSFIWTTFSLYCISFRNM